jgi:hypothetical protein
MHRLLFALLVIFAGFAAGPAAAQATRTWVSGVGDDVNPCSRTAPCKTFAGAISKTAAGGEINAMDHGAFGGVTIVKSITIRAVGVEAGVLATASNGIVINAASTDTITIEGLDIFGAGSGLNGIRILSAGNVIVNDTRIHGFNSASGAGIFVSPSAAFVTRVQVSDSDISNNRTGISANAGLGTVRLTLDRSIVSHSLDKAVVANGAACRVVLNGNTITHNATALSAIGSAQLLSTGNNNVSLNINSNGAPTGASPLM